MLADDEAPVELETGAKLPCHLVDTRSRGGFSGSPVFVFRNAGDDLEWVHYGQIVPPNIFSDSVGRGGKLLYSLLGMHCGQFWEPIEIRKVRRRKAANEQREPILEGDRLEIQSGITIVIPSWRIKNFLDSEVFEVARRKRDGEDEAASLKCPRPESLEDSSASSKADS
jgi:hypothetical protein